MDIQKAVQIGQQGQFARHLAGNGVQIDTSDDISVSDVVFVGENSDKVTQAMLDGKKVIYDTAEKWHFSSSDLMKLNRMKGSFFANLQILNATKFTELVSEIKTVANDGFKLEKVSVNAYDIGSDQVLMAIQAFAAC